MHVDLLTLYILAIGTLLAGSGMTLWERRAHPKRTKELNILATGFATLAIGCAAAVFRRNLPGATGSALSNFVIMVGYVLILHGTAVLNRRRHSVAAGVILGVVVLTWVVGGARWQDVVWNYVSAIPIAVVSGMTSFELLRNDGLRGLKSRHIAVWVTAIHALFYAFRALVLPWLVPLSGPATLMVVAKITMYEGVLYSVILPMTLLTLVREETHGQLLKESQTDYLTGLGNRRWFFEEGARELGDGKIFRSTALLAFDLDQFKAINDRYGHETGDEVLKSFARITRGVMGEQAILARIGGEEFAALLPDHDSVLAGRIGETVIRQFGGAVAHMIGETEIRATVSIGMAHSGDEPRTLAALLSAADKALYRAKSLGGNRLETARSVTGAALPADAHETPRNRKVV